jgi:hypothetical protein
LYRDKQHVGERRRFVFSSVRFITVVVGGVAAGAVAVALIAGVLAEGGDDSPTAAEPAAEESDGPVTYETHIEPLLYAWGSPYQPKPTAAPGDAAPERFSGLEQVAESSLFASPPYLPEGYELLRASGIKAGSEAVEVRLHFDGPGASNCSLEGQPAVRATRTGLSAGT